MKALIVGDSCGALATVRELGRAGWTVGVGSSSRFGWAASSRWVSQWHRVPPPISDLGEFIGAINRAAEKHGYDVIFGTGDAEVLALSANREKIGPLFPYAPHPCVVRGIDKVHLVEVARKAGIATPYLSWLTWPACPGARWRHGNKPPAFNDWGKPNPMPWNSRCLF
jgi:hypothetical protein